MDLWISLHVINIVIAIIQIVNVLHSYTRISKSFVKNRQFSEFIKH